MKKFFVLLGTGLLATTVAVAQDTAGTQSQTQTTQSNNQSESNSMIRGCLSGSAGNYTVTDQNGAQYSLSGDESALQSNVGHEVEITTRQNQSSQTSEKNGTTTQTTNNVQVANVREVSPTCSRPGSGGMSPSASQPEPQTMASAAQQQSEPAAGAQQSNGTAAQQTTPPVTSQTPAAPAQPTGSSQVGTSPANNTGMTENQADGNAQAAQQGELKTNPQTGQTTGRGVNNQGVNNPSGTEAAAGSQNANDQNKPLYERQATDIPWANQPGGNTGSAPAPH